MDPLSRFAEALRESVVNVLESSIPDFSIRPEPERRVAPGDISFENAVFVIIGVTGDMKGRLVYHIEKSSASEIAGRMMMAGGPVAELDRIALSALTEMTNMVTGNALSTSALDEFALDISPPTLFFGQSVSLSSIGNESLAVPFRFETGTLTVLVSLESA